MLSGLVFTSDKERLLRACHELHDLLYFYLSSTNKIFRLLNTHLGTSFPILPLKEHLSIEENLQLLVRALKEMQAAVGTQARAVQECMSQGLPTGLTSPSTSLQDRIAAVRELYQSYKRAVEGIMAVLVSVMLEHDNFPDTVESALHQLSSSPALSLQVSELILDYAEIAKMLQLHETSCTTEGSSSLSGTSQQLELHSLPSSSSFLAFLQATCVLEGDVCIKKSLKIAADSLEEAFRVLKPPCEGFQTFVSMVEACVPSITDKKKET